MKHTLTTYYSFFSLVLLLALLSCGGHTSKGQSGAEDSVYTRVAVDASVYRGLMQMLGVGNHCLDFSSQMNPSVEAIAAAHPDAIMLSAYDGADLSKYRRLGVPVIECRDFLETSALKRAAWMKRFGRYWGVGNRADSLYRVVEREYKAMVTHSGGDDRPVVFFDLLYGNQWYQPVEHSTLGQMVYDAGGRVPFASEQQGGSIALSKEQVLLQAKDADFWLIRYSGSEPLTLSSLAKLDPVYAHFKAFKTGQVYVCDINATHYFDETAFRPDWLIADFVSVLSGKDETHYFKRIQ